MKKTASRKVSARNRRSLEPVVRGRQRKRAVVVILQPNGRWEEAERLYMVAHFDGNLRYIGGAYNVKGIEEANRIARQNRRTLRKMGDRVVARLSLPNTGDQARS